MYAVSRIPNVIAVLSGLLLAGGADAAQAQRRADNPSNIQAAKSPEARSQQPELQMLNTGELPPALSTGHVLRAEQQADPGAPRDRAVGACCVGAAGDPPYDPYECIGDMTSEDCLSSSEETWWDPDESCTAFPPYDCGAPTYCDGSGGCDEFISNVLLPHAGGTIDNSSACGGYEDYTDQVALLLIGMSYDITVTNGNYYGTDVTAVWIDWNGDKDWDDDGETVMMVDPGGAVATGSFSVPPTAIPGYTRMRIRIDYNNPTPAPCGTTTYGEVEDYSVLISGDVPFGACCDPTTGTCTDDVEATDCLPPMQFAMEVTCADAFPNCGNRGACCDDSSGVCTDDVLELDCTGTRHAPGVLCAEISPPCAHAHFIFVFDPGTDPPPDVHCCCPMTEFPLDPRPALMDVGDVPSPCPTGGDIEFSIPLSHRRIGAGWSSWSHGYTGDVYYSNGATEVTLTLPPALYNFYMYVEPNPFEEHTFKLIANGVIESPEFTADGQGGAAFAGVCGDGIETITIVCTSGADFAIGEFGICCFGGSYWGSCCDPYTGVCTDFADCMDCLPPLQWRYDADCAGLEPPCGNAGACCDEDTGICTQEFELNCGGRFEAGAPCDPDPFTPPCGHWVPTGVLYCPSEADDAAFRAALSAALMDSPVDYFDPRTVTPTLADLMDYAAVFTWVNYPYADNIAMGNVLADYVDNGGRVILGQWCQPTAGNYLAGRIMTDEGYNPVSATSSAADSYAGDGFQCPTSYGSLGSLSSNYFDQCTTLSWAFSDGTTLNGSAFVSMNPQHTVWSSPGNTGSLYTYGDVVQLTANMVACTHPLWWSACCDPGTGICTDGVEPMDCLPPLQWMYEADCADLSPPCGNPGACCDIYTGDCADNVFELNCPASSRFEPGWECDALNPLCGTPGACCDDDTGACTIEFEANCDGRFIAGAVCEPDPWLELGQAACGDYTCDGILYAPANPDNPMWRGELAGLSGSDVTYWDAAASTPTLDDIKDYCCVYTWANYAYADNVAMGDVLAEFVDQGGKVILGQWCLPTAGNFLAGQIMTAGYQPGTASSWAAGTYAGDGADCVHVIGAPLALSSGYWDQASALAGAVTSGTVTETGLPAIIWRGDRKVYCAPGILDSTYSVGDSAQLIANICACTDDPLIGACCDPADDACTNDVDAEDCMPPLTFHYQETCETLDPPCGNPGACCDPWTGECQDGVLEINCPGIFCAGLLCEEMPCDCGAITCGCEHKVTLWDDYGDGWNGGFIDIYIGDYLVLGGVTLDSGYGPEDVFFSFPLWCSEGEITSVWTPGGWPYECSYYIYDSWGTELCSDGVGGVDPTGVTCEGNCAIPPGGCCLGYDGCEIMPETDCAAAGGVFRGIFTDCGDPADCDEDGETDECAIASGTVDDCNNNNVPDNCDIADCGTQPPICEHSITMWDSYGNGWNGCTVDVYVNGSPALSGVTLGAGSGPETVFFTADTDDEIFCDFTAVSWATEVSYCVYDGAGVELGCAEGGNDPGDGDMTVTGYCAAGGEEPAPCGPYYWCQDCQGDGIPDGCQLNEAPSDPGAAVITIELLTDSWGYETTWSLTEQSGGLVASGSGFGNSTFYTVDVDVSSTSCYDFTIDDSYGDGIYSPGGFTIYYEGTMVFDAMGGGFTGSTMTLTDIGGGCGARNDGDPIISQLPNQSNGIFSDIDCEFCSGGLQILAEQFVVTEMTTLTSMRAWMGFYPGDHDPAADMTVIIREDAAGMPGAAISTQPSVPTNRVQTGIILFGVHEWDATMTLTPVALAPGTYWVEFYCDTAGDSDSMFWEVGNLDFAAGIMGQAYTFTLPEEPWTFDTMTDMAFELYAQTGPPANDCNENCVPDECDPDCNCDGMPDDCEEPPFLPTDPTIECPADLTLEYGTQTDPSVTGEAAGLDNCGNPAVITYSDEVAEAGPTDPVMYTITRTWTSTDECAELSISCVQTITVMKVALYMDIKPGSCPNPLNRESHGVLPISLLGTMDFDVTEIDITSVRLLRADGVGGEVAPNEGPPGPHSVFEDVATPFDGEPCDCHEETNDGILDLSMKFRTQALVDVLELGAMAGGDEVELVITGLLLDETEFTATKDCILIVPLGDSTTAVKQDTPAGTPVTPAETEPVPISGSPVSERGSTTVDG